LQFKAVQTKLSMSIHSKPSLATVSSITKLVSDAFLLGTWLESFHLEKNFSSRLSMLNSWIRTFIGTLHWTMTLELAWLFSTTQACWWPARL